MAKLKNINSEELKKLEYEDEIVKLIREKYSLNAEIAIIRQKETKPDEYYEWFEYCEQCKNKIKEKLGLPETYDLL